MNIRTADALDEIVRGIVSISGGGMYPESKNGRWKSCEERWRDRNCKTALMC